MMIKFLRYLTKESESILKTWIMVLTPKVVQEIKKRRINGILMIMTGTNSDVV